MKKLLFLKNSFKKINFKKSNFFSFLILRSLKNVYLNKNMFESIRRLISRKIKKKMKYTLNKLSIKMPIFNKPLKVRMGKGKGKFKLWLWLIFKKQKIVELSFFKKKIFLLFFFKKIKKKFPSKIFISFN